MFLNKQNLKNSNEPLFNILIRNTYRPTYFKTCIYSILSQKYTNYRIIICYDDNRCLDYLNDYKDNDIITILNVKYDKKKNYFYNLYMNNLIDMVNDGWIMFLDDDDKLSTNMALNNICQYTDSNNNIIFWKVKQGSDIIFPRYINKIEKYHISTIGVCFHSSHKIYSYWENKQSADYYYISRLLTNISLEHKYIHSILAETQHNTNGMYGLKEKKYDIINFIKEQYVTQINISKYINKIKARLIEEHITQKCEIHKYSDIFELCIFFGIYNREDIKKINMHKTKGYIVLLGGDLHNIKHIRNKTIKYIASTNDIYKRLMDNNIHCIRVIIND